MRGCGQKKRSAYIRRIWLEPLPSGNRGLKAKSFAFVSGAGARICLAIEITKSAPPSRGSWPEGPEGVMRWTTALTSGTTALAVEQSPSPCPPSRRGGGTLRCPQICHLTALPYLITACNSKNLLPLLGGAVRRTEGVIVESSVAVRSSAADGLEPLPLSP